MSNTSSVPSSQCETTTGVVVDVNWTEQTYDEFWDSVGALPPLIRLGGPYGPGAFLKSEPYELHTCAVTGKPDNSYNACFVLQDASVDNLGALTDDGEIGEDERHSRYFVHNEQLTLHEFKALCDRLMPEVGLCMMGWGAEFVDANGDLRDDLQFPIRRG